MNETIIKKVDDLGRIVIPKEMRDALNINTGDEMCIQLNGDEITCRTHKSIKLNELVNTYINSICYVTGGVVVVTDCNKVIATSHSGYRCYIGDKLNDRFKKELSNEFVAGFISSKEYKVPIIENGYNINSDPYVAAIIRDTKNNCKAVGSIILFSHDSNTDAESLALKTVAQIIGDQL